MKKLAAALCLLVCFLSSPAATPQLPPPSQDELLQKMVGTWKVEGHVRGTPAHHTITAEWILNRQFVRLHETISADAPKSEKPYDALWFIGYDDVSDRYVIHLLDIFGPRFSETLGYGTRKGNAMVFIFEYPDGPFHNTMTFLPESGAWHWLLEQKEKGQWSTFADFQITRVPQ